MSGSPHNRRLRAFIALTLLCVLTGGAYVAWAATRHDDAVGEDVAIPVASSTPRPATAPAPARTKASPPVGIVFQDVKRGGAYTHMAVTTADGKGKPRITRLVCERAHFAAGRGLCLQSRQGFTGPKFDARLVDDRFHVTHKLALTGVPSRARVSPDGRYGTTSSFVTGHSYADLGEFSTHATIIDMTRGKVLGDLEQFTVTHEGRVVDDVDRNFWGVTFARNSDRFYATMRIKSGAWLIVGSVRKREARTLHVNVECPSLSPDGTRIAYKKKVDEGEAVWRLNVLDLRTMQETELAETRGIDDQAEWLDENTVLYGLSGAVWAVPADGTGKPRELIPDALSPAVVRG